MIEKSASDAPVRMNADQASAWADGYNSAIEEIMYCPMCGVYLPPEQRCSAPYYPYSICPHAEFVAGE